MLRTTLLASCLLLALATHSSAQTTLKGEALVQIVGDHRIAILLDSNRDASVDHEFAIRTEQWNMLTPMRFESAHIERAEGYVRLIGAHTVIDFVVPGYPAPPLIVTGLDARTFVGYELSMNIGETGFSIARAKSHNVISAASSYQCSADNTGDACDPYSGDLTEGPTAGGSKTYPKCDNGGYGATSCSATGFEGRSCSVSCKDGYFACCNNAAMDYPVCQCVKY
jgi:hypothetical protein